MTTYTYGLYVGQFKSFEHLRVNNKLKTLLNTSDNGWL